MTQSIEEQVDVLRTEVRRLRIIIDKDIAEREKVAAELRELLKEGNHESTRV
jgi:hypothetical protein